ncbi:hypothetical protein GM418_00105 [Maribellus comscasis]|uniref:SRPBCC family protein n=1 Tax=Maribellus comscasis TaxID=2681766 RepID=A0A6I6JIL9_9BACT|nr:hypothetical protein [Maribellus comscasis]QGY42111.1 hypothetical protein GM418_00105 [Maribellus comscasis]
MKKTITAKRISKQAVIKLNDNIKNIFPLFGAFEERKWAEGWNPELIYPETEKIEEGTTFRTSPTFDGESDYLWIVTKYSTEKKLVRYLVITDDRFWTITVQCFQIDENNTKAQITYSFTGLNKNGNIQNKKALNNMFSKNLKDWENEINQYLKM